MHTGNRLTALFVVMTGLLIWVSCDRPGTREYYQLTIYRFDTADQEERLDRYLSSAYLPALHREAIGPVGIFKPRMESADLQRALVVLIPFSSLSGFESLSGALENDSAYLEAAREFLDAPHDTPPYSRVENILMRAFESTPELKVPAHDTPGKERVYELRSYQSPTEELYRRKVEMFNEGEVELFERLGFNPVFFGEVIFSGHMPHLMYMTTFADTVSRAEHWNAFRMHPDWESMKNMSRYQHTVSHIDSYLLYPTGYSDY